MKINQDQYKIRQYSKLMKNKSKKIVEYHNADWVSTQVNCLVIKYDLIPSKSNHLRAHFPIDFFALRSCLGQNLISAPFTMRYLINSHFPQRISLSVVILNVSRATYNGHLCSLRHLHWMLLLVTIDFNTLKALRYLELLGPFLQPYSAHLRMQSWEELMWMPLVTSKMVLGLAPFYRATREVSKSSCWRLKKRVWLQFWAFIMGKLNIFEIQLANQQINYNLA